MHAATSEPTGIGVALSGGIAKVIAHIGVLKALEENGLRPAAIAGTSGGSLIAVLYASGMTLDDLADLAREVTWKRLATLQVPRLGLLSSRRIEDFVGEVVGHSRRLEDLQIPTYVVTTNLLTGDKTVFHRGRVAPVVRASCSIPQIFSPVEIDGGLYADGGMVESLPVETVRSANCPLNVAVHLGAYRDFSDPPRNWVGMVLRVVGLVSSRNARVSARYADVVLKPDLRRFGGFDLGRAQEMMDVGYQTAMVEVPRIRELLQERISFWGRLKSQIRLARTGEPE
jgi:NTE family protein